MPRWQPGYYVLGSFLLVFYWAPIAWWAVNLFWVAGFHIPADLPLGPIFIRTLSLSLSSALLSVVFSYPGVILWRLSTPPIRWLIYAMMLVPLLMGLLARNYAWIGMLSNTGPVGDLGRLIFGEGFLYGPIAVMVVMASVFVPLSFFILVQGASLFRSAHIEAARTLGASEVSIVIHVLFPLTFRAAVLAFGFSFALAVGFFVTPQMIGGGRYDFVGNIVLAYIDLGRFDVASSISMVFLGICMIPAAVASYYVLRRRHRVSGR